MLHAGDIKPNGKVTMHYQGDAGVEVLELHAIDATHAMTVDPDHWSVEPPASEDLTPPGGEEGTPATASAASVEEPPGEEQASEDPNQPRGRRRR